MKNVTAGANPMVLRKGIQKATETAVEAIEKNCQEGLRHEGHCPCRSCFLWRVRQIGNLIADAMEKVTVRRRYHR